MKIERLDFEIQTNHPILARIILFFMLPKFIVKAKVFPQLGICSNKINVCKPIKIYYIPRFKVRKYED